MTFAIRRDGALEGVEINRKAADHRLDAAAVRAVREAAPFPPFPDEFTKETDFLYITRTFGFTASGT
jgi:protein TonB